MADATTTPTVTPENELPGSVRDLSREQRLSKARNTAQATVLRKYRKEFDQEMVKEAAELGVEWTPRAKTAKEKAADQIADLLEKYPELRAELTEALREELESDLTLADAGTDDQDRENYDDAGEPAAAWIAGALRHGRVTADGETFVYVIAGETRRATVDGETVKLAPSGKLALSGD